MGFSSRKAHAKLVYDEELIEDPNNEDEVIGTGVLVICVGLMFKKELLDEFRGFLMCFHKIE